MKFIYFNNMIYLLRHAVQKSKQDLHKCFLCITLCILIVISLGIDTKLPFPTPSHIPFPCPPEFANKYILLNELQLAKIDFFLLQFLFINALDGWQPCCKHPYTFDSKIIRALAIILAIFFWFDYQLLWSHGCYKN